jgi:PAS domain S-box-containing protein
MSATFAQVATEEFIRTAFERCPTGLLVVNEGGQIAVLNREVERQFGYTRDELLGQPVEMLVPQAAAAGHSKLRAQYAAIPTARRMGAGRELFGRHKDGRQIPVEIGLSSISTQDGLFILATIVDVSERRHMEERLRQPHKLEALGNLASGIAHDFNNILAGIIGYTELARTAVADAPSAVADLNVVLDTARRGRDLVSRILLFTRTTEPMRTEADLAGSVRDAIQLLRATVPSNIELREGFDPNIPRVMADNNELHQIVMNLATNAAHAMRSQGGVIEIRLDPVLVDRLFVVDHPGMREGLHVRLSVSDTGTGIHPDAIGHIYEPFFTTKPQGEGTGLGLAVVDRIVQSLGGTIEVRSRMGEGTRFDIYIPSVAVDTSPIQVASAGGLGRQNILLVDDEGSLARLGQRVLEMAGFEVTAHTSSLHALESFRANPRHFDLLITDNTMPHMTGLELVEQVLAIRPTMPILMVSGIGESMSVDALKRLGVTRLLSKPYESSVLESVVRELIEKPR